MQLPSEIARRVTIGTDKFSEHTPKVLEMKPLLKPCEDCGTTVDRSIELTHHQLPEPHWRYKCKNCKLFKNPTTGKYDVDSVIRYNRILNAKIKKRDK